MHNTQAHIESLVEQLPDATAVAALVEAFEPLVKQQALRYCQPTLGAEMDDLEQVARMGLLDACASFDRARGSFPTHAQWRIRSALWNYVRGLGNPVRLPTRTTKQLSKLRRVTTTLTCVLHREPATIELAAAMALSETTIVDMLAYDAGPMDLDAPIQFGYDHAEDGYAKWSSSRSRPKRPLMTKFVDGGLTPEEALLLKEEIETKQRPKRRRRRVKG